MGCTINGFGSNAMLYANFFKAATFNAAQVDPAILDADGYPTSSPAVSMNFNIVVPLSYTGNWVVKWTGTGSVQLFDGVGLAGIFVVSGGTFCGLGTDSGFLNFHFGCGGTNVRVVFRTVSPIAQSSSFFLSGQTYSGMADAVLCREADEANIAAGQQFSPEVIASLNTLRPKNIRTMDIAGTNNGSLSDFANRTPNTAFTFTDFRWLPRLWVGTIGGTDNYTCSGAPSTPVSWTDGESFQGKITNACPKVGDIVAIANNGSGLIRVQIADTSRLSTGQLVSIQNTSAGGGTAFGIWTITVIDGTHFDLQGSTFTNTTVNSESVYISPTINVAGRGAKTVRNSFTSFIGTNFVGETITAGAKGTFVYDALIDMVLFYGNNNGLNGGVPIEAQVQLANRIRANLWYCLPHLLLDSAVTSFATYIRDNLSADLGCLFEYSNEIWNFIFAQTSIAAARGSALGFPAGSQNNIYSWYGLRSRQIMGIITTLWGSRSGLKRVMAAQQFFGTSAAINNQIRFQGFQLNSTNFPTYGTYTGGVNYDTSPNRPIDFADVISYARYFSGAQCANFDVNFDVSNISGLLTAADNYATGIPSSIASAFAFLDNDLRAGQRSGVLYNQTLNSQTININPQWEAIAAGYTGKIVCDYEGAMEGNFPSTQRCTSLGISTTYGGGTGKIAILLAAYKNDNLFKVLIKDWISTYLALPHSSDPGWYTFEGGSQWALYPGQQGVFATPFKSYDALQEFDNPILPVSPIVINNLFTIGMITRGNNLK